MKKETTQADVTMLCAIYFDIKSTLLCCPNIFHVSQTSELSKSIKENVREPTMLWQLTKASFESEEAGRQVQIVGYTSSQQLFLLQWSTVGRPAVLT